MYTVGFAQVALIPGPWAGQGQADGPRMVKVNMAK